MAPKPNPFGQAIQDVVAGAVNKVIQAALPHWHETRIKHTIDAMTHVPTGLSDGLSGLAGQLLDADVVHDVFKPIFKVWAGR